MLSLSQFCFLGFGIGLASSSFYPRNVVKILASSTRDQQGSLQEAAFCLRGSYAVGYSMKAEIDNENEYHTTLNGMKLKCAERRSHGRHRRAFIREIWSGEGISGSWSQFMTCNSSDGDQNFITGFEIKSTNENASVASISLRCRNFGGGEESQLIRNPANTYGGIQGDMDDSCPRNSAVCGIQTRMKPDHGEIKAVTLFCCT